MTDRGAPPQRRGARARRRAVLVLAWALVLFAPGGLRGQAPRFLGRAARAAITGELVSAPAGGLAEEVRLASGLAARMLAVPADGEIVVVDWPIAPGKRADLRLSRFDVYAPGAGLWAIDGRRLRVVPRSRLVFFQGTGRRDPSLRAFAQVDPSTGTVEGWVLSGEGLQEMRVERRQGTAPRVLVGSSEAVAGVGGSEAELDWSCLQHEMAELPQELQRIAAAGSARQVTEPAITALHRATIAVDTDNEWLVNKFANNATSAANYLASLFSQMDVIYERDLLVRLLQGDTFLRLGNGGDGNFFNDDPWSSALAGNNTQMLFEFTDYWALNMGGIQRAAAAMFSGRGGGTAGVAWVDTLCSASNGYSFNLLSSAGTAPGSGSVQVTAHEIGHNLGSSHTHCPQQLPETANEIDQCYAAESGCYSGPVSCPAPATYSGIANVRGTLMSYCHLLGGCSVALVFHPRTQNILDDRIQDAVGQCVFPIFQVTGVSPASGGTGGGTAITVRGAGFVSGAQVEVGGVPASGEVVVDDSTITASTGPHAGGAVSVSVINPGPLTASRTNSFFYYDLPNLQFFTVTPCRVLDTRNPNGPYGGPALAAGQARAFTLAGQCGVPADAVAVSVNTTVTQPALAGHLEFYPGNAFPFGTSTLGFSAGQTRASNAVLMLATDGSGVVRALNGSGGTTHFILDVNGYFRP